MSDKFWSNNISILSNPEYAFLFFPSKNYSTEENMNAIVRFCLYVSLVLIIYKQNASYISIFIASLLFTYFLYSNYKENMENTETKENTQNKENTNPEDIIKPQEDIVRTFVNENKSIDDRYAYRMDSFKQVPKQELLKFREEALKYIWGDLKSCKENTDNCVKFVGTDMRFNTWRNFNL